MLSLTKYDKQVYNIFMIIWLILISIISILVWNGKLRFGFGLGDTFYFIGTVSILGIGAVIYILDLIKSSSKLITIYNVYTMVICVLLTIYIILKMTFWRGHESLWNGQIFFT